MHHIAAQSRLPPWKPQPFLPVSSQTYSEIQQFLTYEALLLDHACFEEWLSLLAVDIRYKVRSYCRQGLNGVNAAELDVRGKNSLCLRIHAAPAALATASAGDQSANSRRFVTNISVSFGDRPNEFRVVSYLRVALITADGAADSAWSAERRDRIRLIGGACTVLQRELLIDWVDPGLQGPSQFL